MSGSVQDRTKQFPDVDFHVNVKQTEKLIGAATHASDREVNDLSNEIKQVGIGKGPGAHSGGLGGGREPDSNQHCTVRVGNTNILLSLLCRALRAAALATILAPGFAAAQPYYYDGYTGHHRHRDAEAAEVASAGSVEGERVFDLPLSSGDHQRVLYAAPARPWATIVMLSGGAGDLGLERDGDVQHDDNFVVRTHALWVARGYAVLIPDTIDRTDLRGVRSSPAYARLVDGLVGFAHTQARGPVFLLGTSQGSIAAMNGAAHAVPGSVAGVVLTESVSRMGGSHETVFSADPQDVTAPALVVANRYDAWDVAPPEDAPQIAAAMTHSRDVQVLPVAGGITKSRKACGSLTPHGYYGIETAVVDQISQWMRTHG